jgi:hypothetical protein
MTHFTTILNNPKKLAQTISDIGLSDKQKEVLITLASSPNGTATARDAGRRFRGEGIYTCSQIGSALTKYLQCDGPQDKMMWIGTVNQDDLQDQRWVMRPEIRAALKDLGWI